MDIIIAVISVCTAGLIAIILIPVDRIVNFRRQKRIYGEISLKHHGEITYTGRIEKCFFQFAEKIFYIFKPHVSIAKREKIDGNIIAAGLSQKMNVETFLGLRLVSAAVVFILYLCICVAYDFRILAVCLLLAGTALGYMVPDYMLTNRKKTRKEKINRELPGILNTLAIMTDAGLSLYEALSKISESRRGIIPIELKQVIEDVDLGTGRKTALMKCAKRCGSEQFDSFIFSICQSMEKGNSGIAEELKRLSSETWEIRKDRAIELGSKASTKLLFPMIAFCFPALFILILGPAFISIMQIL